MCTRASILEMDWGGKAGKYFPVIKKSESLKEGRDAALWRALTENPAFYQISWQKFKTRSRPETS